MNKFFLTLLLSAWYTAIMASPMSGWTDVKQKGADPTGDSICTKVIQLAIDEAAKNGGGTIYFPSGTYLTGALHLRSNITLYLDAGAVLKFSDNPADYLPFVDVRWEGIMMKSFSPLIHAENIDNITIEGRGLLDGQGQTWWNRTFEKLVEIREEGDLKELGKYETMWEVANKGLEVSDYYKSTIKRRFFRPPFFQANHCTNIRITGVKLINSPFWTINPIFCDNITIDGVTIINPESPNTDGINPSSCSNVHIANCYINVGDDCITIKSGRDAQGREIGIPCQNITITNCTMLSGHGGVVIGSEMSGGVKKVTISNCVFDGTDRGIRLKSSRERGGVVEDIRVSNIVMKNIQREALVFDLYYDKSLPEGPFTEKTPVFRNIHISNVTGTEVKQACRIVGIPESPIENLSFNDINIDAQTGFEIIDAKNIEFHHITINNLKGIPISATNAQMLVFDNVKTNHPTANSPVIALNDVDKAFIYNCFQMVDTDIFLKVSGEKTSAVKVWNCQFDLVKKTCELNDGNEKNVKIE